MYPGGKLYPEEPNHFVGIDPCSVAGLGRRHAFFDRPKEEYLINTAFLPKLMFMRSSCTKAARRQPTKAIRKQSTKAAGKQLPPPRRSARLAEKETKT